MTDDNDALAEKSARAISASLHGTESFWPAYLIAADASLSALRPGDRLPGGLVVVPEMPSGDMALAGMSEIPTEAPRPEDMLKAYTAMIAAAEEG